MKKLFIITSAINGGVGEPIDRFVQTLHTIDSIRARYGPDEADILILDSSSTEINNEFQSIFKKLGCILELFYNDKTVQDLYSKKDSIVFKIEMRENLKDFFKLGFLKNSIETYITANCLKKYTRHEQYIKISGRYFLNHNFKKNLINNSNKILLSPKKITGLGKKGNGIEIIGSNYSRMCTMRSVPKKHLRYFTLKYSEIYNYIVNQYSRGFIGDLEAGLCIFIEDDYVNPIKEFGVSGKINNKDIGSY